MTSQLLTTASEIAEAVRSGKQSVEDAVFGFRAAGPALLANTSCYEQRECRWDARAMKVLA